MLIMLKDGREKERAIFDKDGNELLIKESLISGQLVHKDNDILVLNNGKYNETFLIKDIEASALTDYNEQPTL